MESDREVYLEPVVVEAAGERVLIAGKPSYLFKKRQPDESANLELRHVVFGAVVDADGTARTVPAPPVNGGKVAPVAATASGRSRWRVIFVELDSVSTEESQPANTYWHGVYDGTSWTQIERLAQNDTLQLRYYNRSRMLEKGDTVVWAAVTRTRGIHQGAAIFERRGSAWSNHIPTTHFASGVELIHAPEHGFILGVFRHKLNATVLPNAVASDDSQNTLQLLSRGSNWGLQRQISLPPNPAIARENLNTYGDGFGVTSIIAGPSTMERSLQLRAAFGPVLGADSPGFIVDANATPHFATVITGDGDILWVSQHAAVTAVPTDQGELHLIQRSGDAPKVLWRTPNPYLGPFSATAYSASDILIVGPLLDRTHELLVSLIIRVRVECTPARNGP